MGIRPTARRAIVRRTATPAPAAKRHELAWTGMRDSLDPTTWTKGKAFRLQNVYPLAPETHGGCVGRPGFDLLGSQIASARGQRTYQFTKRDGTQHTIAIFDGEVYEVDWSTETWSKVLSTAQLASSSITLDSDAIVAVLTLADECVFSDGVNTPFSWDGTSGGGLTKLTNCPVLYGQPTVHQGRMFGIKAGARGTFVWCEPGQLNVGYEAGGYNNAWDFVQTDAAALSLLVGSNNGLYVFRTANRGISLIVGDVDENYVSHATDDGVSDNLGTDSPFAAAKASKSIYFVDSDGHPQRLRIGGGVVGEDDPGTAPIWEDCRETTRDVPRDKLGQAVACYRADLGLVLFSLTLKGRSENGRVLGFKAETGEFACIWTGFEAITLDMVLNGDLEPTMLHTTLDGYVQRHGHDDGLIWTDTDSSGEYAIDHVVHGGWELYDTAQEWQLDRVDLTLRAWTDITNLEFSYLTPRGASAEQMQSLVGGQAKWDDALWDQAKWPSPALEVHAAFGLDGIGRYCRPQWRHRTLGERFGVNAVTLWAFPTAPYPTAR